MIANRLIALIVTALICVTAARDSSGVTFGNGANTFDIEFVRVGNPGNPPDGLGGPAMGGSVSYSYGIGKYEISEEMIDKANALGGLGITKDTRGPHKPATSVSWNEAARFVNWLNTSTGGTPAYKFTTQPGEPGYNSNANIELWTSSDADYNPNNPVRNKLALYSLPHLDEWYKAAYYDSTIGVYYEYPTSSNDIPDGIDSVGDTNFDAVFDQGHNQGSPNDVTNAGVLSPYGTMAQGGNVEEWLEGSGLLLVPGGSWSSSFDDLIAGGIYDIAFPNEEFAGIGFRVASRIPEPSTLLISGIAGPVVLWARRQRRNWLFSP